ncbi:MAG TPA: PP2C family protein-serine/threonine phosphatase [Terriglobia bacterium]|nr:PP2C family protein-serine/threonine phosphatase [Terriglobia bacterium]
MNDISGRLACFELWGGNGNANHAVELPGLEGWVYSTPLELGAGGGDVHYLSVCSKGRVSRIAVADVAGHGSYASSMAENLRRVFQHHTDNWDQSALMRELNEAFARESTESQFATATVLGFYLETGELLFSSAGHPPALWYRAQDESWELLQDCTPHAVEIGGLPLGLIPGTAYSQTGVRLASGDTLVLYTDGITEARDSSGSELGQEGLLNMARSLTIQSPADTCRTFLSAIQAFRGDEPRHDDETLLLLKYVN